MLLLIEFDQFIVSARSQMGLGPLFRVQIYYKINLITLLYVTQSLLLDNNPPKCYISQNISNNP